MKKFGLFLSMLLLAAAPAMAIVVPVDGTTNQCWDFNEQNQYGILPSVDENPYAGNPVANINDMSGQGVFWDTPATNLNGYWYGSEFKIIIDIPNTSITTPDSYKNLTINMRYQGDISFMWMADAVSGTQFTTNGDAIYEQDGEWKTYSQDWYISPNPREEIIVIGLKAPVGAIAAIDQICIYTECIPEPATMALLALGMGFVFRRR